MGNLEITREYIKSCLLQGADDIMEAIEDGSNVHRHFNMNNGYLLCLEMDYDDKDKEDIYVVPEKSVHVYLVHYEKDLNCKTLCIRKRKDVERVAEYFAYQLGVS